VTGAAREKFIFVAQGPLFDDEASIDFHYEMFNRDIRVYTVPDGFLWSRDPVTGKDLLLDSIHIDAVINVVHARFTLDGRMKNYRGPLLLCGDQGKRRFRAVSQGTERSRRRHSLLLTKGSFT